MGRPRLMPRGETAVRTTIVFPRSLLRQLRAESKRDGLSFSECVRDLLGLALRTRARNARAMKRLEGGE